MDKLKLFKNFLYLAILILVGYIISSNNFIRETIITSLGGYIQKENIVTIDSTFVRGKIDTLEVFNHYVKTQGIILDQDTVVIPKYIYLNSDKEEVVVDNVKKFEVSVNDSLIDGKMTIYNDSYGNLVNAYLDYKPLFPRVIRRVDTIKIHTQETITLSNKKALIGFGAGYNNLQYFSLLGSYTSKKKWQFIYEYGKSSINVKNNTYSRQAPYERDDQYLIPSGRSDFHSFKIIKHF